MTYLLNGVLRIYFTDSFKQTTVLLFFLTSLFTVSDTAPIGSHNQNSGSPELHWWQIPCGKPVTTPKRHHHSSKECTPHRAITKHTMKELHRQINTFMSRYKVQLDSIKEYYKNINCAQLGKRQYRYEWLPRKPNQKTIREYRHSPQKAFVDFHKDIQIYAVAFYQLNATNISTQANIGEEFRQFILRNLSYGLRGVMCATEKLVNDTCPHLEVDRIPEYYLQSKNWASKTDFTAMCLQDRAVHLHFEKFIIGWKRLLKKIFNKRHDKRTNESSASSLSSLSEEIA